MAANRMMYPKAPTHRSEAWRRAVASLPCIMCKRAGPSQAAHCNHRGKGMSLKAPDCWTVPLCPECHREFDQGGTMSKHDKRALMDEWLLLTLLDLAAGGMVRA